MSCKTETKTIDSVEYSVIQFPPLRAIKILHRLMRYAAPALKQLKTMDAAKLTSIRDDTIQAMSTQNLGMILEGFAVLVESISEAELEKLFSQLLSTVRVDGKEIGNNIDSVFMGNLSAMLQVAILVLKVNYANFLPDFESLKMPALSK